MTIMSLEARKRLVETGIAASLVGAGTSAIGHFKLSRAIDAAVGRGEYLAVLASAGLASYEIAGWACLAAAAALAVVRILLGRKREREPR